MLKEIAVQGCIWKFVNPSHQGVVVAITPPSQFEKLGTGVYKDKLAVAITGGSDGAGTTAATGAGVINATSLFKMGGQAYLRKGDKNNIPIVMTGVKGNQPSVYTTTIEIDYAGQTFAKSD